MRNFLINCIWRTFKLIILINRNYLMVTLIRYDRSVSIQFAKFFRSENSLVWRRSTRKFPMGYHTAFDGRKATLKHILLIKFEVIKTSTDRIKNAIMAWDRISWMERRGEEMEREKERLLPIEQKKRERRKRKKRTKIPFREVKCDS